MLPRHAPQHTGMINLSQRLTPTLLNEVQEIGAFLDGVKTHFEQASDLAELGVFSSMFAHEVNNLMTQVGGRSQLALMHMDRPELTLKALQLACHASTQIAQLSGIFLEASQTDTRYSTEYQLGDIHTQALEFISDHAISRFGFAFEQSSYGIRISAPPIILQQVLLNTYLNAIRALEEVPERADRRVWTRIERLPTQSPCSTWNIPMITITVEDTGIGMEQAQVDSLFSRNDQFQPAKNPQDTHNADRGRGHGLGLAVCKKLLSDAGGSIAAYSTPGAGTKMVISIPESPASYNQYTKCA